MLSSGPLFESLVSGTNVVGPMPVLSPPCSAGDGQAARKIVVQARIEARRMAALYQAQRTVNDQMLEHWV
jgi:hypothetical protein